MNILLTVWFCLSAFQFAESQSRSNVIINELNVIDPRKPEKNEFIEIKSTSEPNLALRGYKIIGISCYDKTDKISLVATLWNERMKNGYFTIGGSGVPTADLKIPHENIKFKDSFLSKKKMMCIYQGFSQSKDGSLQLPYYMEKEIHSTISN